MRTTPIADNDSRLAEPTGISAGLHVGSAPGLLLFGTGQPLTYPAVQKSGAAAAAGDLGSEDRRQLAFD